MAKRYPRETAQMLFNPEEYLRALSLHGNPLSLVEYSFVHRKAAGCYAITQQPLSHAAQTWLYVYCYVQGRQVHLLCIGDKSSQPRDNRFCRQYVNNL